MCARFRFIEQHHNKEINVETANKMYGAIKKYVNDENFKYNLYIDKVYFERIDWNKYNGNFFQVECFTPVTEKTA